MKFNTMIKEQSMTLNHEGAEAFGLSAEMELYTAVVTASLSDKFYETANERIKRIAELVGSAMLVLLLNWLYMRAGK